MATAASTVPTVPTVTKDMWVANLVDPWEIVTAYQYMNFSSP
jgi:hypothetical protein